MKLVLPILAALALAAPPVQAQTSGETCGRIDGRDERLACYDSLFREPAEPLPDQSVVFQSEQLIPARPSGRERALMTVACEAGNLSVQFSFAGQLLSATGSNGPITFQLDLQSARTHTLRASPDNRALGFWTTPEAQAFLDTLPGADNLTVRVTPSNQRSLSVRFSLAGIEAAIDPIRSACE